MQSNVFFKLSLITVTAFFSGCIGSLGPDPMGNQISVGYDKNIDTTVTTQPDLSELDNVIIRNSDASLYASPRFGGDAIYQESELGIRKGLYHKANDFIGRQVALDYSFIAVKNDTLKHRPFILFVHEGAFLFGSSEDEINKAKQLARNGYATASINYRVGFNGGTSNNPCGGNRKELAQAIYRAVQDINMALHHFMIYADDFGIDPGHVVLAGSSAGAIAISALVYMTESDFEKIDPGISKVLGKLDPSPPGGAFQVSALLTSLGYGVLESSYITSDNAKPTVFFQRTGDDVLAYEKGPLFFCPGYFSTEGAKNVSGVLRILKQPYEVNYEPASGHRTSYPDDYVAGRYAKFLKRLWGNDLRQIINENYGTSQDIGLQ